jgi:glycosyltransferase involved in cell wall biosynthesis
VKTLLYFTNRYRVYDQRVYETLLRDFAVIALWLGPPPTGEEVPENLAGQLTVHTLDSEKTTTLKPWHLMRGLRLLRLLLKLSPRCDLVVCSTADSWKAKVAYLAARLRRIPLALRKERWLDLEAALSLPARLYWKVDDMLTRYIERRAAAVLVAGSRARHHLSSKGIPESRILPFSYLHRDLSGLALDPELQRRLAGFFGDSLAVLYLGRIMPQKGLANLIRVVRRMIERGGDLKLLVCGEPIVEDTGRGEISSAYHEECLRLADGDPRISFFGPAPPRAVQDFYSAADVFVHPHVRAVDGAEKHDGWGLVVSEAACMSRAIVASDRVASAHDIVVDRVSGFLLRSQDLERQLEAALTHFLENREDAVRFGLAARRRFEEVVDPEKTLDSLHRILALTLATTPPD